MNLSSALQLLFVPLVVTPSRLLPAVRFGLKYLKVMMVLGQTHTYTHEEVTQKSSEVRSEVFSKISTKSGQPSNHLIAYCRTFLHYPFQNCDWRQPNVPSNKLVMVCLQITSFRLSPQLTTGKLQMQHTQRNLKDLSVNTL